MHHVRAVQLLSAWIIIRLLEEFLTMTTSLCIQALTAAIVRTVSTQMKMDRRHAKDVHMENTILDQCQKLAVAIRVRGPGLVALVLTAPHLGQEMVAHVTATTEMATQVLRMVHAQCMVHQKLTKAVQLIVVEPGTFLALMAVAIRLVLHAVSMAGIVGVILTRVGTVGILVLRALTGV